jgi:hypothetical protein
MSARSIRRAAERAAINDARLHANRANSQFSSGPTSPEGKKKSSMNALKNGLTSQSPLLPTDDAAAYERRLANHFDFYRPANQAEETLVQFIADTEWRTLRVPSLEAGIFALGRLEFADAFPEEPDPVRRAALINTKISLAYEKQIRNLHLQERRLRNQLEKDMAKLDQLQNERRQKRAREEQEASERAQKIAANCQRLNHPFNPAEFGFDFSTAEYQTYCARNDAQFPLTEEPLHLYRFLSEYRKESLAA